MMSTADGELVVDDVAVVGKICGFGEGCKGC